MKNTDDILKKILLHMNYDSKKTLRENESELKHNILENFIAESNGFDEDFENGEYSAKSSAYDEKNNPEYWDGKYVRGEITFEEWKKELNRIDNIGSGRKKYASVSYDVPKETETVDYWYEKMKKGEIPYTAYTEQLLRIQYNKNAEIANNREYYKGEVIDVRHYRKYWDDMYSRGLINKDVYKKQIKLLDDEYDGGEEYSLNFGSIGKPSYASDETDDEFLGSNFYDTYLTVIPNVTLTVPSKIGIKSYPQVSPVAWHKKDKPFDKQFAEKLFGIDCKSLSGENPKYQLGYSDKDYYIDKNGDRCSGQTKYYWVNTINDKTYDYKKTSDDEYFYTKKGTSDWVKSTGETKKLIKSKISFENSKKVTSYEYPEGCKPLPYEVCLRWSLTSLYQFGGIDKGLTAFELIKGVDENGKPIKEDYQACITTPDYVPWESKYTTFNNVAEMQPGYTYEDLKITTARRCPDLSKLNLPYSPSVYFGDQTNISMGNSELAKQFADQVYVANKNDILSKRVDDPYSPYRTKEELTKDEERKINQLKSVVMSGLRIKGK